MEADLETALREAVHDAPKLSADRPRVQPLALEIVGTGIWRLWFDDDGQPQVEAASEEVKEDETHALLSTDVATLAAIAARTLSPLKAVTTGRLKVSRGERELLAPWFPVVKHAGARLGAQRANAAAKYGRVFVDILETRAGTDPDHAYTEYGIVVEVQKRKWWVWKRYSAFRQLWKAVGDTPASRFPPKVLVQTASALAQRRRDLNVWLREVVNRQMMPYDIVTFLQLPTYVYAGGSAPEGPSQQVSSLDQQSRAMRALRKKVPFEESGLEGRQHLVRRLVHLEKLLKDKEQSTTAFEMLTSYGTTFILGTVVPLVLCRLLLTKGLMGTYLGAATLSAVSVYPSSTGVGAMVAAWCSFFALAQLGECELPMSLTVAALVLAVTKGVRFLWVYQGLGRAAHIYVAAFLPIIVYTIARLIFKYVLRLSKARSANLYEKIDVFVAPFIAHRFVALKSIWVKIGQFLSGRGDVVNHIWQKAFKIMQADMPTDTPKEVDDTLKKAFKKDDLDSIFSQFDYNPIASASIAQVHRARLAGSNREVAVKIQHSGVGDIFRKDIQRSIIIARVCAWLNSDFDTMVQLLKSWETEIENELNFETEAENLREVRRILVDEVGANVIIPEVVDEYVSRSAFVMEYVPNLFKADDAMLLDFHEVDKTALVSLIVNVWCCMLFQFGVFNADPHPGNCMVQLSEGFGARPVLLDWGWTVRMKAENVAGYRDLVSCLLDMDVHGAVAALKRVGYASNQDDRAPERSVQFFAFLFSDTGNREKAAESRKEFMEQRKKQKEQDIKDGVRERGGRKMQKVPTEFGVVARVIGLLRGLAATLEVEIPLIEVMATHAELGRQRAAKEA